MGPRHSQAQVLPAMHVRSDGDTVHNGGRAMHIRGRLYGRFAWRRRTWKYCAGVEGTTTNMFASRSAWRRMNWTMNFSHLLPSSSPPICPPISDHSTFISSDDDLHAEALHACVLLGLASTIAGCEGAGARVEGRHPKAELPSVATWRLASGTQGRGEVPSCHCSPPSCSACNEVRLLPQSVLHMVRVWTACGRCCVRRSPTTDWACKCVAVWSTVKDTSGMAWP